jgi:hypothetical protein
MSDEETAPAAGTAVVDTPAPAAQPPAAPPAESVDQLPEFAQKLIRDLRSESATYRTKNKEQAEAQQASLDAIAKALGLKGDDDPAKAAQTAAEERDAARKQAQDATTTLAVYRMAAKQGVNAESLTDSRAFMRQLDAIDPADAEFAAKVEAAIQTAVEANPLLKTMPSAPPARSGGPVGGGAAVPGQVSDEEVASMSPAEIAKALEEGRLASVLSRREEG